MHNRSEINSTIISYLITDLVRSGEVQMVLNDGDKDRFRFASMYSRQIKRINSLNLISDYQM